MVLAVGLIQTISHKFNTTMKPIHVLLPLALCLMFSACRDKATPKTLSSPGIKSGDSISFPALNDVELLKTFFLSDSIVESKTVLWKPTEPELYKSQVSADGYLHTMVDTTLSLNDEVFVLFRTDVYDSNNKKVVCSYCTPALSISRFKKVNGKFELIGFKNSFAQHGGRGDRGKISLESFPDGTTMMRINSWEVEEGTSTEEVNYYSPETFEKQFTYEAHHSNGGKYNNNSPEYERIDRQFSYLGQGMVKLEVVEVKFDEILDKQVNKKYSQSFTLGQGGGSIVGK